MTFGTGGQYAVSTNIRIPLTLDFRNAAGSEIEIQVLESTGDGMLTAYLGDTADTTMVFARLPALSSEAVQRPVKRLNPRQEIYLYADLVGRCTVLVRLFRSGGGCS